MEVKNYFDFSEIIKKLERKKNLVFYVFTNPINIDFQSLYITNSDLIRNKNDANPHSLKSKYAVKYIAFSTFAFT